MDCIVLWLNNNSGAIIAVSTFSLVCVTAYYAFITSRMVRIIEKQTAINIEPIITIEKHVIEVTNSRITLKIRNEGTINVVRLAFYPMKYIHRFAFPVKNDERVAERGMWTVGFSLTNKEFKAPVFKPRDELAIELDVAACIKSAERFDDKLSADFAYRLSYLREADHKPYDITRYYVFDEGKFLLASKS